MDKSHARIGTIGQSPTPTPRSDAGVVDRGFRADFSFADIFPVKSDTELCYGNPVAVAGEGSQSPSTWSSSWSSSQPILSPPATPGPGHPEPAGNYRAQQGARLWGEGRNRWEHRRANLCKSVLPLDVSFFFFFLRVNNGPGDQNEACHRACQHV